MEKKTGATVSSFLVAVNLSDSDLTAPSIAALKTVAITDESVKLMVAQAVLSRIRHMPTSKWNAVVVSTLWRHQLFLVKDSSSLLSEIEKFLSDGLIGLDHATQAGILRSCAQMDQPSSLIKQAMVQFLSTKPTSRPLLAVSLFLMRHQMGHHLAEVFSDEKYAIRVHSSLLRIQKEIDRAFATEPESAEDERIYLTAMAKLRDFLTKALGEDGEIFKVSPLSLDSNDFSCSSCGRKIKVASGRTDARMRVNCSNCGAPMSGPPDTE
jgi:hypothetical protein